MLAGKHSFVYIDTKKKPISGGEPLTQGRSPGNTGAIQRAVPNDKLFYRVSSTNTRRARFKGGL